jgi:predicted RNase H-related nuclease YkuK (DUF458 family)
MFNENQIESIVELLSTLNSDTRVYFGCDSVRFVKDNKKFARYATVCIIHKNGKNGCKLYSHHSVEPDFDVKAGRPKMRMLNEVRKVCELYVQLAPFIDEFPIEIHLDINLDPKHGSSCAASEAAGYVVGMTGIEPKLKPDSWAASFGADGSAHGKGVVH